MVIDDPTTMNRRDRARLCAKRFLETIMVEPEAIRDTDGMFVLRDVPDLETWGKGDIVIRKITEPFWEACIAKVDEPEHRYRVCAVGTSGIGKTTCTPVLIRLLLQANHTVVYHIRTAKEKGYIYEFLPDGNGSYTANVYQEAQFDDVESLQNSVQSTYYVVDPGMTDDSSCNPDDTFQAKVIIVSSPDSKHWGRGEFSKRRGNICGFFLLLSHMGINRVTRSSTSFQAHNVEWHGCVTLQGGWRCTSAYFC
jgi:hypothetical protein